MRILTKSRILRLALCLLALSVTTQAQINLIYTFNSPYDGCCPTWSNLIAQGRNGYLYTTLPQGVGAAVGSGSWFYFAPSVLPVIHGLPQPGPSTPDSGLTLGVDGNFYGATQHGGLGNGAYGVLFKISAGAMVPVYYFTGGTNGTYPFAAPIQGPSGYLYGTTYDGSGAGVVYKVDPASGTLVWARPLPSGTKAPLIVGSDGYFYGTYPHGGMTINGVAPSNDNGGGIFRVTPAGVVTGVYNINPLSTTSNGGFGDGGLPWGPVMQAGNGWLYGTTSGYGRYNGGTIYKIHLNGTLFTVLHNFQAADGISPQGGVVQAGGFLYGLCSDAGTAQGLQVAKGTLFKIDLLGNNFAVLFNFYRTSSSDGRGPGSAPIATPTLHTGGVLYGMTSAGGTTVSGATTYGVYDDGGELFSYNTGISPFLSIVGRRSAPVNARVQIIGQRFLSATGVTFGGVAADWSTVQIMSNTFMTVVVPAGALTGPVQVITPSATYQTQYPLIIN
jgi:uncharacterized repeat protein (TIGR03803 family)